MCDRRAAPTRIVGWLVAVTLTLGAVRGHAQGNTRRPAAAPYGGSAEGYRLVAAQAEYEAQRKNPLTAFALELVLPGMGNVYVGEREEALLEWFGLITGLLFLLDGRGVTCGRLSLAAACATSDAKTVVGIVLLSGSWLFGVTTAPLNASRANAALRARLGLDAPLSARLTPLFVAGGAGAGVSFAF